MTQMMVPVLPESAPFTPEQRAWLNGFFAGIFGKGGTTAGGPVVTPPAIEEDFPWHDAALALPERMALAEGKPLSRKLMAAMAQLDCGSCGLNCKEYAEAIATGADSDISKCSPGGRETQKKLRELLATDLTISVKPATQKQLPHKPAPSHFVAARRLTASGSAKDVRHVIMDLNGSNLSYEVGDSLGVMPRNCGDEVTALINLLGAVGNEVVPTPHDGPLPLAEALRNTYTITNPTDDLLELMAKVTTSADERADIQKHLMGDGYSDGVHVVDLMKMYPFARPSLEAFVKALRPIQPRLYSISSSLKATPGQVHLTVGVVRYENAHKRSCKGVASTFLGERVEPGEEVRIFVHEAKGFRLPPKPETPIIMVGPGTGIAPFRAFLQERKVTRSPGKSWLFFGDQKRDTDFLYKEELEGLLADGILSRLDLAFSRDQAEKVYVQHRMIENGRALFEWLEQGAHFYVCGDAKRMAKDVDQALLCVIETHGKKTKEQAVAYVAELKNKGRYQRDVY